MAVNKRGFGCVAAEDERVVAEDERAAAADERLAAEDERQAAEDQGGDAEQMDERCMRWTISFYFTNDYLNVICIPPVV